MSMTGAAVNEIGVCVVLVGALSPCLGVSVANPIDFFTVCQPPRVLSR
jgi:hypothetical protein